MYFNVRYMIIFLIIVTATMVLYTRCCLNLAMISMTYADVDDDNHGVNETIHKEEPICPFPEDFEEIDFEEEYFGDDNKGMETTTMMSTLNGSSSLEHHHHVEPPPHDLADHLLHPFDLYNHLRSRKYHWDQSTQGQLLGCYFWSYVLFQVTGGLVVQKFGGRWILVIGLLCSGIISIMSPFVTDYVGIFIALRVLLGIAQAAVFPALFQAVCQWIPLNERSISFSLVEFAAFAGSIVAFFASGIIYKAYGWPMEYFVPGILSLVTSIPVALLFRDEPSNCKFISERELKLIRKDIELIPKGSGPQLMDTPFRKICFNRAILACSMFKYTLFWNSVIICTKVPSYLSSVLHVDLATNGQITAIVCLLNGLMITVAGFISERVLVMGKLSRTNVRKAFSLISGGLNGFCVLCIPYCGCDLFLIQIALFSQAIVAGFGAALDIPLPAEMTRNYPAFVYAYISTLVLPAGFLAPWIAGVILDVFADKWTAWCFIYQFSAGQTFFATIVFILLASAERQPFDFGSDENIEGGGRGDKKDDDDTLSEHSFHVQIARRSSIASTIG